MKIKERREGKKNTNKKRKRKKKDEEKEDKLVKEANVAEKEEGKKS